MAHEYDVVIRGGTVMDGNGGAPFEADVAIKDGKIAAVGAISGSGTDEIDAKGLSVTPGFVDLHTHYDGQAMWDSHLAPSSWHGVTTVVMGNCGVGFAPVRKGEQDQVIALMEGVEDLPGPCLNEGLDFSWESFGEFLTALERRKHDIDFCALLPHAPMRVYVMGDRAMALEEANQEDIARMRELTADAVRAGAFGFSTSRTIAHKTLAGDPHPGLRAHENELMGIAMGMKDAGGGFIEMTSDWNTPKFISEDRAGEGIFLRLSVGQNLVATKLSDHSRLGILEHRGLRAAASRLASAVGVDLKRLRSHADELSGGNQQKLAFGRCISGEDSGVLLMNEPTRGVDVGARAEIYRLIRQFCDRGYCLIMASSDIEEVLGMSDIIVSMYRGRQIAAYRRGEASVHRVLADITHPVAAA